MTDDSIEAKALALFNEVRAERGWEPLPHLFRPHFEAEAICRAIEQHEAFRLEVSNAVKDACKFAKDNPDRWAEYLAIRFSFIIIPKPKPDPLVEIIGEIDDGTWGETKAEYAAKLRAALDARGWEIREKGQ
jgi:hypothetical protein